MTLVQRVAARYLQAGNLTMKRLPAGQQASISRPTPSAEKEEASISRPTPSSAGEEETQQDKQAGYQYDRRR